MAHAFSRESSLSRRTMLKGAAGLTAGAAMISLPGRATTRAQGSGAITVGIWPFAHEPLQPFADAFTAQTGITVTWAENPSAGGDQVTQLTPQFASDSTPIDVLSASDEAAPLFLRSGWLEPLDDLVSDEFWADFPEAMKNYVDTWSSLEGSVFRIPHGWEYGYFWTRKDLLDQLGVATPASWDDLLALGAVARGIGAYAFGDAASQPSLAFVYAAYLAAQAGGDLFTFDEGTRTAFEFAKEMVDTEVFPKAAINWTYDQSNAAYMEDQLVTMRQWSFFYDVSRANTEWFADDKVVIALPPSGPKQRATWAGAWGWTIPKFTANMEQAKAFMSYITSAEIAGALAKALSNFVCPRQSVLEAIGTEGISKNLAEYSEANVVTPRPFHPRVSEAQTVVDTVFSGYLSGQFSLDDAISNGQRDIEALEI